MKRAPSERHCRWADDEAANLLAQDCAMRAGKLPTEPRGRLRCSDVIETAPGEPDRYCETPRGAGTHTRDTSACDPGKSNLQNRLKMKRLALIL